jgi:hypothetical protein
MPGIQGVLLVYKIFKFRSIYGLEAPCFLVENDFSVSRRGHSQYRLGDNPYSHPW